MRGDQTEPTARARNTNRSTAAAKGEGPGRHALHPPLATRNPTRAAPRRRRRRRRRRASSSAGSAATQGQERQELSSDRTGLATPSPSPSPSPSGPGARAAIHVDRRPSTVDRSRTSDRCRARRHLACGRVAVWPTTRRARAQSLLYTSTVQHRTSRRRADTQRDPHRHRCSAGADGLFYLSIFFLFFFFFCCPLFFFLDTCGLLRRAHVVSAPSASSPSFSLVVLSSSSRLRARHGTHSLAHTRRWGFFLGVRPGSRPRARLTEADANVAQQPKTPPLRALELGQGE